jgi:Ran GTPase-activating protein (RanGAP) involved in mRNA processing and transport
MQSAGKSAAGCNKVLAAATELKHVSLNTLRIDFDNQ